MDPHLVAGIRRSRQVVTLGIQGNWARLFLLLILLVKMPLAEFSIEIALISNALIGALLAAKAALILDETPLAYTLKRYRGIVAVAAKVLFTGSHVLGSYTLNEFSEALHKFSSPLALMPLDQCIIVPLRGPPQCGATCLVH